MRFLAYFVIFTSITFSQTMTEVGAAAAGGSIAGASGKKVSEGLTAVLGKVSERTVKAAGREEKTTAGPALTLGPGVPKGDTGGVPLPPPPSGHRAVAVQPPLPPFALPQEIFQTPTLASVGPALPPPPEMSPQELKTVGIGMSRADLLKFGAPASKITTFEDGHVSETYSYRQQGQKFGTIRLTDGAVASVEQR
jgi:hypothetical protein